MTEGEFSEYQVLINEEAQFSLWPAFKAVPPGWTRTAQIGDRSECLAFVEETWRDLRPLSIRGDKAEATDIRSSP